MPQETDEGVETLLHPQHSPPTSSGHSHATPCTRSLLSPSHWWQFRDRNSSFHPQIVLHKALNCGHSFSTAFQWHLCLKAGSSLPSGTPAAGGKEREGKGSAPGLLPQLPCAFTFCTQRCSEEPRAVLPCTTLGSGHSAGVTNPGHKHRHSRSFG